MKDRIREEIIGLLKLILLLAASLLAIRLGLWAGIIVAALLS